MNLREDRFVRTIRPELSDHITPEELAQYLNATAGSQGGGWKVTGVGKNNGGGLDITFTRPVPAIGGSCNECR
jgi:hypothetical protein